MCYSEKHTVSKLCTLELLGLATVNVFTGILWNIKVSRNRPTWPKGFRVG